MRRMQHLRTTVSAAVVGAAALAVSGALVPMGAVAAELKVLQEVGIDQHHGDINPIRIGDNDQKQQGDHPKPALTLLHGAFLSASG